MIQTTILFIFLAIAILYAAYITIKQLRTLDIMVIGAILYLLDFLMPQERGGQTNILRTAGLLIFLYGYGILVLEKFREGRRMVKS